jgi:hypothetical protein
MAYNWKISSRFNEDVIKSHSFIWNSFKYDENFKNMNITSYTLIGCQEIRLSGGA